MAGLTPFQIAVAELFFALPESDGFLLAGGAALAAQQLTQRATQDLDLFTRSGRSTVPSARDALERAVADRERLRASGHDLAEMMTPLAHRVDPGVHTHP